MSKIILEKTKIWTPTARSPSFKKNISYIKQNETDLKTNEVSLLDYLYVLYDKKPLCVFRHILFSMTPIKIPTLGYKLIESNLDYEKVMGKPKFITERQAIDFLFLPLKF